MSKYIVFLSLILFSCKTDTKSSTQLSSTWVMPDSLVNKKGVFLNTDMIDMGILEWGVPVKTAAVLINHSSAPISGMQVTTTCGCVSAVMSKKSIAAGDTAYITITYDAKIPGLFSKDVYVDYPGQLDVLRVEVKGHVKRD